MSLYDYKNATVVKRTETIEVQVGDFIDILTSNDLNRVQKVIAIRNSVRDSYVQGGYRDVTLRFVDGVVDELIKTSKQEHRPLPSVLVFEVDLYMPLVEASNVPVGLKSQTPGTTDYRQHGRSYKDYGAYKQNDHIYWS